MSIKKIINLCLGATLFFIFGCSEQSNYDKAVSYQQDAEYSKAIEFYNKAIEKGEKVAICEKNLGDIFFGDKNYDEAFYYYKCSLDDDPTIALDTVLKFISYNDAYVRKFVGIVFSKVKNEQAQNKINNALATILKSGDQNKIVDVLAVISIMKSSARPIVGNVIDLLDSDDNIVKQKTLEVLPNVADVVVETEGFNKLIEFLSQKDEIIKEETIECLGNMHEYAIKALFSLLDIAVNESRYEKKVLSAVDKLGLPTKDQMEQLYSYLQNKPKDIKIHMINLVGNFEQKANIYVPYIINFLDDADSDVKQTTRDALTKIGKSAPETIPELIKLLDSKNTEILSRAIYELGDLGKASADAVEPLKKIVETSTNRENKTLAMDALKKIQ